MKVKTSELIGPALNWAVAKCEEQPVYWHYEDHALYCGDGEGIFSGDHEYSPSTDWFQGGLIIEREKIGVGHSWDHSYWLASAHSLSAPIYVGPTPLIATMRCYVATKLGDEIEIPEELA